MRRSRVALEAAAVFLVAWGAFAWTVLPQDALVTIDGYFHMRLAQQMGEHGPFVGVRGLPLTLLGEAGPDHHWLWHLLLMPFGQLPDLFVAMKWAATVAAAAVAAGLHVVARALRLPWPALFALLGVAGALLMPGRLVMLGAQNLAVLFIAAALWGLHRQRPLALALVAFLFLQAYHAAVILAPLALLHVLVAATRHRRLPWRPAAALAAGAALALALNPWFPRNVEYLFFHTLYKVSNTQRLSVGAEWGAPPLEALLTGAWPVLVALLAGAAAFALARRRDPQRALGDDTLLWLLATALFFAMHLTAWRFVEYLTPAAALAAGLLFRDAGAARWRPAPRRALAAALALVIAVQGARGLAVVREQATFVPSKYAEFAAILRAEAAPGERVFNRVWEDYVFLYWHNPQLTYVNGLDPHYLAYADPGRFRLWQWVQTVAADDPNDPAPVIAQAFGARWVVVNRAGRNLAQRLGRSPYAVLRHESRWGWLFELRLPPG